MASTVMCVRVFFLVAAVAPGILLGLLPPVGAMALAGAAAALFLRGGAAQGTAGESQVLDNPFRLRSALVFGALFALVLLALRGAQTLWGQGGLFVAALLSGLVDVDAISIAAARGAPASGEGVRQAQIAIVIACASNSVFKAGIAIVAGKGAFRLHVAWALAAMVGAAALGLALGFGLLG